MNKFYWIATLFILIAAFGLRVYKISTIPGGLTWDEAAIGYNAFSISKTLRGEHGMFMPMTFKSFGDYKPPIYIYLTAPFVYLFDLNEFSTRILSVLAGTLSVLVLMLFVRETTKNISWSIFAGIFLAFSPWHIFYSRGAWETNLMVMFLLIGLLGIIRSSKLKGGLWWGLLALFLAMMTYQAGKLYVPLLLVVLYISGYIDIKNTLKNAKSTVAWSVFAGACLLLLGMNLFTDAGNRLNRLSIFNYKPDLTTENQKYDNSSNIFHILPDFRIRLIASRYLTHYSTDFLFLDNKPTDRGHLPKIGVMYWIDALLLLLGLVYLSSLNDGQTKRLITAMLLIAAIPGSLTLAEFSSTRNLFMVVPLIILSSAGASWLMNRKMFFLLVTPIWLFCFVYFWDILMFHSSAVLGKEFNIAYKKVFQSLDATKPERAVISDVYGQPYIYYLFYGKIDPAWYQKQGEFRDGGIDVGRVGRVGTVEFRQFDMSEIRRSPNAFFAGGVGNYIGEKAEDLENIDYSDEVKVDGQEVMFKIVKTK